MGKIVGKDFTLLIGGTLVTQNEMIDLTYNYTSEKADTTGAGDTWKSFIGGIVKGMTITFNGFYNASGSRGASTWRKVIMDTFDTATATATFEIRRAGTASGYKKITGSLVVDSIDGPTGGLLEAQKLTATCTATGTVTEGTQ